MKICYLILAHNNPQHFERLLNAIITPNSTVFVHIDAKSSFGEFAHLKSEKVIFIENRVSVNWGEFSMVQATLNLLEDALAKNPDHDYFCLLSGSDYPLKSAEYIEHYFEKNSGNEFIRLFEMPNNLLGKPLSRITTYKVSAEEIRKYLPSSLLAFRFSGFLNKLNIQRKYERVFQGLKPYAGSQWWVLSREAVQHIMIFISKNPKIVKFFKNTEIPDESFFQTIIGNSRFKQKVVRNVTFSDWSRPKGPYPAIIDMEHIRYFGNGDVILEDNYGKGQMLFARKFPNKSQELVDVIHKEVW